MEISIDTRVVKIKCSFCPKRYMEITVDFLAENFWIKLCVQAAGVYMEISIDMLQLILKSI